VFNPRNGETAQEAFDLKGNPTPTRDWWRTKYASTGEEYNYTVAHWALTEARFRKHIKAIKEEEAREMILLDDMLVFITQDDVIYRRVFDKNHRSCVPDFGCYIKTEINGKMKYFAVSRQMVLFAVERRKAWRMLQSKAGVVNKDYLAQKALLAKLDKGELQVADLQAKTRELFEAELAKLN
jgi:pyruvate-ferredoxin/flavodoxin oxidoreductase